MGILSCLNVAGGDIAISFDTKDQQEAIRAKRIIKDMMKRGYALLVKMPDGTYQRALEFDEQAGEYIIADHDPDEAERPAVKMEEITQGEVTLKDGKEAAAGAEEASERGARKRKAGRRRLAMETSSAVGVARSAGG